MAINWQMDKKIPLAILIVLLGNLIGFVWFASALNSRVGALEASAQNGITVFERLVRLETQFDSMKESINRIDNNIAKLTDSMAKVVEHK